MDRLRVLTGQIVGAVGQPCSSLTQEACSEAGDSIVAAKGATDLHDDKVVALKAMKSIIADSERLMRDGTLPSASFFDLGVVTKHNLGPPSRDEIRASIREAEADGRLSAMNLLPGPWRVATSLDERVNATAELALSESEGHLIFRMAEWQQKYGDAGLASNIVVPAFTSRGIGAKLQFGLHPRVIIGDPADAERIARLHVRKEGNFELSLFDGVIATTDNEHWKNQRRHLAEAFLPLSSLAAILPKSLARAKFCAERLADIVKNSQTVDMSDFLLHEAQAQLQLALLGASEEFMESTNAEVRAAFNGDLKTARVGALTETMKGLMELAATDKSLALPSDACPVRGPLSRAVSTGDLAASTNYGNMLLILFAGHDTTGHTMTWLLFELARHPEMQRKLQQEVDGFFKELGARDPAYVDLSKLEFMDRCITETLRMWPAVANGTFRQLQFDDNVAGPGGTRVELPKGTPVQIVNWPRHRNPALWGQDANEFNPYRSFEERELAHVGCPMAAVSPESGRFSPFAHAPRSCLGRNFAQMEMRLIMCYVLRKFEFRLAPSSEELAGRTLGVTPSPDEFRGLNFGTMGPMDMENKSSHWWGTRHYTGLKLRAVPRGHTPVAAGA